MFIEITTVKPQLDAFVTSPVSRSAVRIRLWPFASVPGRRVALQILDLW